MFLARFVVCAFAAVVATIPLPLAAQPFSDEHMFNVGRHAGRVAWAMRWCGAETTESFANFSRMATQMNPRAFKRGLDAGILDGVTTDRESGRQGACWAIRGMYGPEGLVEQGFIK
jgi:hypothetical protein